MYTPAGPCDFERRALLNDLAVALESAPGVTERLFWSLLDSAAADDAIDTDPTSELSIGRLYHEGSQLLAANDGGT